MFNLNSCIYLDNASTSRFKPKKVIKAVEKELKRSANPGRASHSESLRVLLKVEETRDEVRTLVGDKNVVFTKSCTEALNLAILGSFKGGEIITTVYEHNSVLRPIERLKSKGAVVKYLQSDDDIITPKLLEKNITKRTSLVVVQEMSNLTGVRQDIESLGTLLESYGIPFIVDTAQSVGHVRTDYKNVDMVTAPAHKGLHGVQGTGYLAFKKGLSLVPLLWGGTGTDSHLLTAPISPPESYEAGTLGTPGIIALKEGITFTKKHFDAIVKREKELSLYLIEELNKLGAKVYSTEPNGVVSFNLGDRFSTEVADILDNKYGICVRAGLHCAPLYHKKLGTLNQGAIRVSFGWNNGFSDVEKLLIALKEML